MRRLSIQGLGCTRGFRTVFQGVNFELGNGDALALVGPNGSGKSSLLRLIAGLLHPAQGAIRLEGSDERTIAEQAHYLGHLDAFKPALTVAENLSFWSRYLGAAAATEAALKSVGLEGLDRLPAAYLSAGQRRRLSLARLIAVPRPLWLLDEPASALDAAGQAMLTGLMREHLEGGGLIVAATHGPLGIEARQLQLGQLAPSPGGGSESMRTVGTPTPSSCPQGGGEHLGGRGESFT